MVAAVRVHKVGGPEVLTYEDVEVGAPAAGQIRIRQHACGINYIDTYMRTGLYPAPFFHVLDKPVNKIVAKVRPDYFQGAPRLNAEVISARERR